MIAKNNNALDINIESALVCCNELENILEQEKACLISGDIAQFQALLEDKSKLISMLVLEDTKLQKQISALAEPLDASILQQWQLLQDTLEQCKRQSSINGAMINHSLKSTYDALAVLRGGATAHSTTYTNNGRTQQQFGSKTIAKI